MTKTHFYKLAENKTIIFQACLFDTWQNPTNDELSIEIDRVNKRTLELYWNGCQKNCEDYLYIKLKYWELENEDNFKIQELPKHQIERKIRVKPYKNYVFQVIVRMNLCRLRKKEGLSCCLNSPKLEFFHGKFKKLNDFSMYDFDSVIEDDKYWNVINH